MTETVYQITGIRDTKLGHDFRMAFNIPMNTPLMFIRTKQSRLAVKRITKKQRRRAIIETDPQQVSLL